MRIKTLFAVVVTIISAPSFAFDTATISDVYKHGLAITAGAFHTCTLEEHKVTCWGNNEQGQTTVPRLNLPIQIAAGQFHTCALDDKGVICWGDNENGQSNVPLLNRPTYVAAGLRHTCAIVDDLRVQCWGDNEHGQLNAPRLNHPSQIALGLTHTCALDDNGVRCWGWNGAHQTEVPNLTHPIQVSAGENHTCALDDDGVKCWGDAENGKTEVPALVHPTQISSRVNHTCALDTTGVKCWGLNDLGQSKIPALVHPTLVAAGEEHTCALDDGEVKCWGSNREGQKRTPAFASKKILFDPQVLEQTYQKISGMVYRDKGLVLKNLSKTLAKYPISDKENIRINYKHGLIRLFSMHAIEPLIHEAQSPFIDTNVLPNLVASISDWQRKFELSSAQEIVFSPGILDVSFTLIESGLQASKSYLNDPQQRELEDLMLRIAQAKVARAENIVQTTTDLVQSLDAHQPLISDLSVHQRTIGFGNMITRVQGYLKNRNK